MNQLNSIIVEGNVVRSPEVHNTASGIKVCSVPIAVNRFYKNSSGEGVNEVSYFDVESYKNLAEACVKNCDKGRGLRVVGRLKQNRWKNQDGKSMAKVSIIAEHIEFKPRFLKNDTEENGMNSQVEKETEDDLRLEPVEDSTSPEEVSF